LFDTSAPIGDEITWQVNNTFTLPDVIRINKSRRMRWAKYVVHLENNEKYTEQKLCINY